MILNFVTMSWKIRGGLVGGFGLLILKLTILRKPDLEDEAMNDPIGSFRHPGMCRRWCRIWKIRGCLVVAFGLLILRLAILRKPDLEDEAMNDPIGSFRHPGMCRRLKMSKNSNEGSAVNEELDDSGIGKIDSQNSSINKSGNEESASVQIPSSGSLSRRRTESETEHPSSSGEHKNNETEIGKRQRTLSPSMFPMLSASPPGFVSLEEIMKAANSVSKMTLAHEIAVDSNFQLEKIEPPENSLQKMIKETMHRAFFDVLREELSADPPEYERALKLLEEIKQGILSLLLPHQTKTQQEINEKLDIDLVRQQAEAGTLNFKLYSEYIISMLAKLCAPSRDEKIRELTALDDIVLVYKGIIELLELMRLDMANFTIRQIRPQIVACSAEYERKKFEDYLKVTPDGLRSTREWLYRHRVSENKDNPIDPVKATATVLVDAFMELLQWDASFAWPETLAMDETRLTELRNKIRNLEYLGAVLLVAVGQGAGPHLQNSPEFRATLKEHVVVLLENIHTEETLKETLPAVASQIVKDVDEELQKRHLPKLPEDSQRSLQGLVTELSSPANRIRDIIRTRMLDFLRQVISSEVARPTQIPPGLSILREELAAVAGQFARLVSYNRAIFSTYYAELIKNHCLP
nr:EOG090X04Z9 [Eulimnadia texana]